MKKFEEMSMPFVSDLDQFLQNFDKKNPQKSASQKAVIKKTQRVFELRDRHNNGMEKNTEKNLKKINSLPC